MLCCRNFIILIFFSSYSFMRQNGVSCADDRKEGKGIKRNETGKNGGKREEEKNSIHRHASQLMQIEMQKYAYNI
ncbi:hypothetical protein F4809DRAFT_592346 [Biscogniauxia mediterranea]|nr:hypothetical protein F4809DRAFT_592346 [Biscogniauxia mediterranea]